MVGGATLLSTAMPEVGVSCAQALSSPVAVGQGCGSMGMWGAACSGATSWGADPRAKGSRELPPSPLRGCWARPPGLVKQQDRSRLGVRGTGKSLNKEFLIWNSLGPAARYSPPHSHRSAGLSAVPPLSLAAPHPLWFHPLPFPGGCSGHLLWVFGAPLGHLHCPGLSPCACLSPVSSVSRLVPGAVPGLSGGCRYPTSCTEAGGLRQVECKGRMSG